MEGNGLGHVVVVEDDYDISFLLMNVLEREDWLKAVHIPTAEAAMNKDIWSFEKVVGIIDLYLPRHSGIEIARWANNEIGHVPLIAMTAASTSSLMYKQAVGCGYFDRVLEKPLKVDELLQYLKRVLNA